MACPTGKVALGGGFDLHGAPGLAHQTALSPVLAREMYSAAEEKEPIGHDWEVTTYVICADR